MRYALTDVIEDLLGHPVPERSQNAMVKCPFHGDQHASMSIDLDRGLWVCFGCGEKGGMNKLARLMDKELNEGDVLMRSLAAATDRGFEEPPDFTPLATRLYAEAMDYHPVPMARYFADRGLHAAVLNHYQLGWDAAYERIAMPYWDDGRVIGIKYRSLDGSKSSEKGSKRYIYGVDDIRGKNVVILCEGESDTHAVFSDLTKRAMTDTIAACGFPGVSASKANWELYALEFIWASRVYVAYDADEAGDAGAVTPMSIMGDKARRLRPTKGKDMAAHLMNGGSLEECGLEVDDLLAQVAD